MYDTKEELNNLVWDKNDEDAEEGQNLLRLKDTCRRVERLAEQRFEEKATLIPPLISGGFNILYRLRLPDVSPDIMVRLPCPGLVPSCSRERRPPRRSPPPCSSPGRQTYPSRITSWKRASGIPCWKPSGAEPPLISCSSRGPASPASAPRWKPPAGEPTRWSAGRVTHNMADMVRLANVPREILPPEGRTYETADEWYAQLADMHMAQLVFQHNDLVTSEDDCRNKYTHCNIARQILRRLARQGKLSTFRFQQAPTPSRL
ncbi:hypothetical protein EsHS_00006365 [Epichloe bromicola]